MDLMTPVTNLTDCYNLTELHHPDVVVICEEMAAQPEFLMYGALLDALGLRCVIYGRPESRYARGGSKAAFAVIDESVNADQIRACISGRSGTHTMSGRLELGGQGGRGGGDATYSRCVVIGSSTGGIEALLSVLASYPPDCPPTLIVQHIRPEFVPGLVQRLDRHCLAKVSEARQGAPLEVGRVYVAPEDQRHLVIRAGRSPFCKLIPGEPVSGHRPSVDMLFRSAVALGEGVVGVLLTGMGRDGAEGLLEIRRHGGRTIVQDRFTSTVYGMPRAAVEIGAAMQELPLSRIGSAILMACRDSNAMAG
ncbi:MAG: chemotaxis protein CheB [Pararhodobacter sp.]|nr:chemotaxis protein CheB [Pararhodobacter sp.]